MARMTKEERKLRRKERREARRAARSSGPEDTQGQQKPRRLGRRERRQARRQARLEVKLAGRPQEPVERGPVVSMLVGKRSQFTEAQLAHHNLDLVRECPWDNIWVIRYEGEGYVDGEALSDPEQVKRTVGHFKVFHPEMTVTWLNERSNNDTQQVAGEETPGGTAQVEGQSAQLHRRRRRAA